MSHRRAKQMRQLLLPNPRREAGVSRGRVIRDLNRYLTKENINMEKGRTTLSLILHPRCPRAVIQRAKRYANQ